MSLYNKKYKAVFGGTVTKISGEEIDKYVSLAGLEKLKGLMPDNIDLKRSPDVLAIALNAAVGNYCNKNYDSITNEATVAIAQDFVWKYVNIGHDRERCVGVICNYGFSDFIDNKLVTAEETKSSTAPTNLSLACLLWKGCLSDKALKMIEDSGDPTSLDYGRISASWELYFDDYDIAVGPTKNIADCTIYKGEAKAEFEKYLPDNKRGPTKADGNYVFRVMSQDGLVGAGIGLVAQPAAEVEGLVVIEGSATEFDAEPDNSAPVTKPQEQISEKEKQTKNTIASVIPKYIMKYPFLKQISEAEVQTSLAGEFDSYLQTELKKASDEYQAKLDAAKNVETELAQKIQVANDTLAQNTEKLAKLEADVISARNEATELKNRLEAKSKEDLFNSRMDEFEATYELASEHRKILASRLNKLETAEDYDAFKSEMVVLLASLNKETLAKSKQTSTASVAQAIQNAETQVTLPNSSVTDSKAKSHLERVNETFGKDNVKITVYK